MSAEIQRQAGRDPDRNSPPAAARIRSPPPRPPARLPAWGCCWRDPARCSVSLWWERPQSRSVAPCPRRAEPPSATLRSGAFPAAALPPNAFRASRLARLQPGAKQALPKTPTAAAAAADPLGGAVKKLRSPESTRAGSFFCWGGGGKKRVIRGHVSSALAVHMTHNRREVSPPGGRDPQL